MAYGTAAPKKGLAVTRKKPLFLVAQRLTAAAAFSRSLSGFALSDEKNAKKHSFRAFFPLQTPKGAQ